MNNNWDLIIAGGGVSGFSAALSASAKLSKILIIEKNSFLGGSATAGLVFPMMKTLNKSIEPINQNSLNLVLEKLKSTGNAALHSDGNPGWFNPEILKCVFDELCEDNGIDILYDTNVIDCSLINGKIDYIECFNKSNLSKFKANYYIDATGDADLAYQAGVKFDSEQTQAMSLRFNMANVDLKKLAIWLNEVDPDSGVSSVDYNEETILLTTAHTMEDKDWKLRPFFEKAIAEKVIMPEDAEYFQIFSIPGQNSTIGFNCPRIYSEKPLNPLDQWDISYAYKQGRKQILRIAEFCKKYLVGFESSYISQIAQQLGVRCSRRIKGKYVLSEDDILEAKKFNNPAARSNYPIDIHGQNKNKSELKFLSNDSYYEIPIESLLPVGIENLLVVGKPFSATFRAQASARIIPTCFAMGEAAGKYIIDLIEKEKKVKNV